MVFTSFEFIIFLIVFLIVFYLTKQAIRKYVILIASVVFYIGNGLPMFLVLLFVVTNTYVAGVVLNKANRSHKRRAYYIFSFALNILLLLFFKYTNFFVSILNSLLSRLNVGVNIGQPTLLMPLGLSFFVFETCTYIGSVYKVE